MAIFSPRAIRINALHHVVSNSSDIDSYCKSSTVTCNAAEIARNVLIAPSRLPVSIWHKYALLMPAWAASASCVKPRYSRHTLTGLANPVKVWREYRGLTQDALAAQAGISKAYLCQIETGKREGAIKTLRAISAALQVTVDDLQ